MSRMHQINFAVPEDLFNKAQAMPHGLRSEVLRVLLEKAVDAAERKGSMIYGAIIDGAFELTPKE